MPTFVLFLLLALFLMAPIIHQKPNTFPRSQCITLLAVIIMVRINREAVWKLVLYVNLDLLFLGT